jgi:PAS domain-containing protein
MFCNLREGERKLEEAQRLTHVGYWERDLDTDLISWSDETNRIFGFQPQERTLNLAGLAGLIHPEDQQIMVQAVAKHFRVGSNNSIVLDHKLNPVRGGPPAKVGAAGGDSGGVGRSRFLHHFSKERCDFPFEGSPSQQSRYAWRQSFRSD